MDTASDAAERGSDHELPAGDDWPKSLEESSWWPIFVAVGAIGLYLGAATYFLGHGSVAIIPPIIGPVLFGVGVVVVGVGMTGWMYHGFVDEYWNFDLDEISPDAEIMGMTLFLLADGATFAAGFVYFFFIRLGQWPVQDIPNVLSPHLATNTCVLVASSFTIHAAHKALKKGRHTQFTALVGSTMLLGWLFVFGQIVEYHSHIVKEGFTMSDGSYGTAFFALTGLHGLHVLFGTVLLAIVFGRALMGQYSKDRDTSLETVSMYWHFVDAVWLVIVTVVYISASYPF